MSPSLGYIPSTFPMSIFTDSPEKQPRNDISRLGADSSQNTNMQFSVPPVQDPYSIRFPLTYSPRRRQGPFFDPLHQQSQLQPQAGYNFNYGYDIPSELPFAASLPAQSTSVHSQSQAPLVPITESGRYPLQAQHQQIPIAYAARLTDLTAFALNMKKSADASARSDDVSISNSSQATASSKSGNIDEKMISEIIAKKGRRLSSCSCAESYMCFFSLEELNKENEQFVNNQTRTEDHSAEPIVAKDNQGLGECKESETVPRRLLRSASAQTRLAELES